MNPSNNSKSNPQENRISQRTRNHLQRVYTTLTATTSTASLGAFLQLQNYIQINPSFASLLGIGLLMTVVYTRPTTTTSALSQTTRLILLLLFGLVEGLSLGPLLTSTFYLNPGIILNSLIVTLLIFVSFSLSALFAQRRSYLYLGGILGTGINILLFLSFLQIFGIGGFLGFEAFFAVILFSGFVCYDTQVIVERSELTESDYVGDSAELFLDFVNLFLRVLEIFSRRDRDNRRRDRDDDRNNRFRRQRDEF